MFLELTHGRPSPHSDMEEKDTSGPIFGPFDMLAGNYASVIRMLRLRNPGETERRDCFLWFADDTIYYDGVYYGDWFVVPSLDRPWLVRRHVVYDQALAEVPTPVPGQPEET